MISLPNYTIKRELGRGGMAIVYEAVHAVLMTHHAIKVLSVSSAGEIESTHVAKFLAEARILATLRHPNIVRVTDAGTLADGRPYLVMDLLANGSLTERLAAAEPPSPETVRAWYVQLRSALAFCHQHGIVHGDIKSENVLLDTDGQLVLSDFGIARLTDREFRANLDLATATLPVNFGTPYTLAPECRHGEKASQAADVYSFGVLIFKCLTGLWFEGSPRLLKEIDAAFPEWSKLLRKMLAHEINERFASANELPEIAPVPNSSPVPNECSDTIVTPNWPEINRAPFYNPNQAHTIQPQKPSFIHTVRNWFIGSCITIFIMLLINYTWKFFHMYNLRNTHPDWLHKVFP